MTLSVSDGNDFDENDENEEFNEKTEEIPSPMRRFRPLPLGDRVLYAQMD